MSSAGVTFADGAAGKPPSPDRALRRGPSRSVNTPLRQSIFRTYQAPWNGAEKHLASGTELAVPGRCESAAWIWAPPESLMPMAQQAHHSISFATSRLRTALARLGGGPSLSRQSSERAGHIGVRTHLHSTISRVCFGALNDLGPMFDMNYATTYLDLAAPVLERSAGWTQSAPPTRQPSTRSVLARRFSTHEQCPFRH